jgi:FkbM family methyltransferase
MMCHRLQDLTARMNPNDSARRQIAIQADAPISCKTFLMGDRHPKFTDRPQSKWKAFTRAAMANTNHVVSGRSAVRGLATLAWAAAIRLRNGIRRLTLLRPIWDPLEAMLWPVAEKIFATSDRELDVTVNRGIELKLPPRYPSYRTYATGLYERGLVRLVESVIKEGMTVVDVGANVGYYSTLFSRLVGPAGRVYAFEPDADVFKYLVDNLRRNGCDNVSASTQALSNSESSAQFVPNQLERGYLAREGVSPDMRRVTTTSLDYFIQERGWCSVDFVKLDIEGGEAFALKGMKEVIRRNPMLSLFVEFNQEALARSGTSTEQFQGSLQELGFEQARVVEEDLKAISLARALPPTRTSYNLYLAR